MFNYNNPCCRPVLFCFSTRQPHTINPLPPSSLHHSSFPPPPLNLHVLPPPLLRISLNKRKKLYIYKTKDSNIYDV